ncbi:hypothetical protein GIB67_031836 [Kingdonia uniflora]|uniref:Exostosin GT47 domain-containing protein n=1 Tax=Kingdonia uniflora TaxID=39325 RepID=A0A7J7L4N1_9MAGN|nr:hypothetical protein GIB67_031836 [Kingdonia uniflora]
MASPRKSILKPTLATVLTILSFYALFNTFLSPITPITPNYSSKFDPFDSNSRSFSLLSTDDGSSNGGGVVVSSPVRVYLYDLPKKFTFGVIDSYLSARGSGVDGDLKYPGNQHSAEWYLFKDLIDERSKGVRGKSIVRVLDPDEADLFYVPFFSSLSLVVNPIRPAGVGGIGGGGRGVYSDEEMQESLIEWLEGQVYWRRNNGWDHVFICQDPNALYKVIDRVKNGVLLVSDFGRLRGDQASLVKDVILPYSHRINPFKGDVGIEGRDSLLFFMGNRYRKEGGKVRDLLFQVLEDHEDVIIKHGTQSRENRRMASQGMHSSKFCLHPAGDTPSACRLFDAIVSLCIPVIVSDRIELPFEDIIDYKKIAVFVDSERAVQPGYLIKKLKKLSTDKILEYQKELKESHKKFILVEDREKKGIAKKQRRDLNRDAKIRIEDRVKKGHELDRAAKKISRQVVLEMEGGLSAEDLRPEEIEKVKRYFEYEDPNGTVSEIWRQVSLKASLIKLMINRDKRLVRTELTEPDCACLCSNKTEILTTSLLLQ